MNHKMLEARAGAEQEPGAQQVGGRPDHVVRILGSNLLTWTILSIGILLRAYQFSIDRGLWVDEARVALNVLERSPIELLRPLEHDQVAPFGFLWLEKLAIIALGSGENVLRLLPLLAGIASLFLFQTVARRYLAPEATNIGLFLFAASPMLVYFSAETKQYSLDVLVALGLTWIMLRCMEGPVTLRNSFSLGVIGMAATWFSHTAVLVLIGFAVVLAWRWFRQGEPALWQIIPILALWGTGGVFCALLPLIAVPEETSAYMDEFWSAGFLPFPPTTFADIGAYASLSEWLLRSSLMLWIPGVGLAAFAAGLWFLTSTPRPQWWTLLLAPLIVTILASMLSLYPLGSPKAITVFASRPVLFLVPSLILVASYGIWRTMTHQRTAPRLIGKALFLLVVLQLVAAVTQLPVRRVDHRPALAHLSEHHQSGDRIYTQRNSTAVFLYYASHYGLDDLEVIPGRRIKYTRENYASEIMRTEGGGRTWFLFSAENLLRFRDGAGFQLVESILNQAGQRLRSYESDRVSLYLYDMSSTVVQYSGGQERANTRVTRPDRAGVSLGR